LRIEKPVTPVSCDFFGSHIASTDLFVTDEGRTDEGRIKALDSLAAAIARKHAENGYK